MWITLVMALYHRQSFRHNFYWLISKDDVMEVITKCKDCQFFQKQTTKHSNPLRPIDLS
jgi:transposase InsO family protein